jgi:hypothetical protein
MLTEKIADGQDSAAQSRPRRAEPAARRRVQQEIKRRMKAVQGAGHDKRRVSHMSCLPTLVQRTFLRTAYLSVSLRRMEAVKLKKVKFQTFCRFTVKCYFACACGVNMRMPFSHNGPFACSSLYGAAFLQKLLCRCKIIHRI